MVDTSCIELGQVLRDRHGEIRALALAVQGRRLERAADAR
jgi:hypothetical protein